VPTGVLVHVRTGNPDGSKMEVHGILTLVAPLKDLNPIVADRRGSGLP
jgi:hypothetical protein